MMLLNLEMFDKLPRNGRFTSRLFASGGKIRNESNKNVKDFRESLLHTEDRNAKTKNLNCLCTIGC